MRRQETSGRKERQTRPVGGVMRVPANDLPLRCIDDVEFGDGVVVYSFTNLYGCRIGAGTRTGTFVEIARGAVLGERCKNSESHLQLFAKPPGRRSRASSCTSPSAALAGSWGALAQGDCRGAKAARREALTAVDRRAAPHNVLGFAYPSCGDRARGRLQSSSGGTVAPLAGHAGSPVRSSDDSHETCPGSHVDSTAWRARTRDFGTSARCTTISAGCSSTSGHAGNAGSGCMRCAASATGRASTHAAASASAPVCAEGGYTASKR